MRFLVLVALIGCSSGNSAIPNGEWQLSLTKSTYSSGTLSIQAPQASLTLILAQQGKEDHPGCTLATSRLELVVSVANGNGNGSITYISQKSGATCSPSELSMQQSLLSSLQIQRTSGSGSGFDQPDGTWKVSGTRPDDVAEMTFQNGTITGTFKNRMSYSFSASLMSAVLTAMDTAGATLATTQL